MEIKLSIKQVLPLQSGTSKSGNAWSKQEYVGETFDKFPKNILFSIFGDEQIRQSNISQGNVYNVHFDIESRSYTDRNGVERWSTDVKAWKVEPATADPAPEQQQYSAAPQTQIAGQAPVQAPSPKVENAAVQNPQPEEDLPF